MASSKLRLAVVSPHADAEGDAAWNDLASFLRANTEVDLERITAASYEELTRMVRSGDTELAWLPPVVYAWLAEAVNPIGCIVRGGGTSYRSALVVPSASDVKELGDLKKKRVGWVDRWSAAGYVVPRIELARMAMDPTTTFEKETFFGTHAEVVKALVRGDCDVAATFARKGSDAGPWDDVEGAKVRVLARLGSIPSDVLAARRNLATVDYERAVEAFRKASSDAGDQLEKVFNGRSIREGVEPGHEELRLAYESALARGLFD